MKDKLRRKYYKAVHFFVRHLRYRRLEGWSDETPTSEHFIRMIRKYSDILWPHTSRIQSDQGIIKAGMIAQSLNQKKDSS